MMKLERMDSDVYLMRWEMVTLHKFKDFLCQLFLFRDGEIALFL